MTTLWKPIRYPPDAPEGVRKSIQQLNHTLKHFIDDILPDEYCQALPLTTKGDLLAYSTEDVRLPVGSDGDVLIADSGETSGIKWGNIMPVGGSTSQILIKDSGTDFDSSWGVVFPDRITYIGEGSGLNQSAGSMDNTFFGFETGKENTSGKGNTLYGSRAGDSLESGSFNTVIGTEAGRGLVSSGFNTFIGNFAGYQSTGSSNVFLGRSAGSDISTGDDLLVINSQSGTSSTDAILYGVMDTTVGNQRLSINAVMKHLSLAADPSTSLSAGQIYYNTTDSKLKYYNGSAWNTLGNTSVVGGMPTGGTIGQMIIKDSSTDYDASWDVALANNNTRIGLYALDALTTGRRNTALGDNAGRHISTGNDNISIGYAAGYTNTGDSCIFMGYRAGYDNESGADYNIGIGHQAFDGSCSGGNNIGIGRLVFDNATSAEANVGIGSKSLQNLTDGDYNTCLGYEAGNTISSGSRNILLGMQADVASASDNYKLIIGSTGGTPSTDAIIYGEMTSTVSSQNLYVNANLIMKHRLTHEGLRIGFFSKSPVVQAGAITGPTGGSTIDTEARTAINSILTLLSNYGLMA